MGVARTRTRNSGVYTFDIQDLEIYPHKQGCPIVLHALEPRNDILVAVILECHLLRSTSSTGTIEGIAIQSQSPDQLQFPRPRISLDATRRPSFVPDRFMSHSCWGCFFRTNLWQPDFGYSNPHLRPLIAIVCPHSPYLQALDK